MHAMRERRSEKQEAPEAAPPGLEAEYISLPGRQPHEWIAHKLRKIGTPDEQAHDFLHAALGQIRFAHRRHPEALANLAEKDALLLLRPTDAVLDDILLYQSHGVELLDRFADGKDLRPATTAEVIGVLRAHAEVGKPDRAATLLLDHLEERRVRVVVHGEERARRYGYFELPGEDRKERRAVQRLEASLRKKLACERMPE